MAMKNKTAVILSFAPVTEAPRVLRQASILVEDGWNVVLCGYEGRTAKPEDVTLITVVNSCNPIPPRTDNDNHVVLEESATSKRVFGATGLITPPNKARDLKGFIEYILPQPLKKYLRNLLKWSRRFLPLIFARFSNRGALKYYWSFSFYTPIYSYIISELTRLEELQGKEVLIIAHDYFTMPVADRLAEHFNCQYVTDIHEYAYGQYMHNLAWRLILRPWVDRMQRIFLPKSAFNTAVCDGIADLLKVDYPQITRPTVMRSTPSYQEMPFKPTGDTINVLYHGILFPVRGMELALQSLKLWRPEFHLLFRGPCDPEYFQQLQDYAKELGVQDRFTVEPPVTFDQIIPAANKADIGYFVHKDSSPQKRFALPNKFFEYITAGLALCVSDLPEMAKISREYDLGVLVSDFSPEEVAAQINSMSREDIDRYKRNSLKAAAELCWEKESAQLLSEYNSLVGVPYN